MVAGVTYEEAKILLGTLAMTQPRILALSMMLPIFNRNLLPGMLRYAVATAMGLILVPALAVDYARWEGGGFDIVLIALKEAFVGLVLGYLIALPFWIFEAAGFIIDNQRGASLGATLNPGTGNESSPMGILFNQAFMVFFLTSGGFFLMMTMLVTSFQVWSIWDWWPTLHASSIPLLLDLLDKFLRMTLLYAAPAVIAMFLAEVGLALVSRFAPQLQVFFLAMPIKSALALLVLVLYTKVLFEFAWESVADISLALPFLQREVVAEMSGEKTEPPSQKRLRDSRKKGEVAHSKDFTQTVLILAIFGYMIGNAGSNVESFGRIILTPANFVNVPFEAAINTVFDLLLQEMLAVILPFFGIVIGIGIFSEAMQVGLVLAFPKLLPSAKKLNVISNLKNIFSKKNLVEFLKSLAKIIFLTILVVQVIREELPELMEIPHSGLAGMGAAMGSMMRTLIINIAVAYFIISVIDLGWQRMQYRKGLMMSKEEVKQEYKEMEGDPHIKHARKHLHQEMAMNGAVEKTRKASVVVTNPTHLAIALYYEEDAVPLPIVLAKGEGALAAAMVKAAREEGIPVMQNIPLARALMAQAHIDQYIPAELIVPTAELLRLLRASIDQGLSDHG